MANTATHIYDSPVAISNVKPIEVWDCNWANPFTLSDVDNPGSTKALHIAGMVLLTPGALTLTINYDTIALPPLPFQAGGGLWNGISNGILLPAPLGKKLSITTDTAARFLLFLIRNDNIYFGN